MSEPLPMQLLTNDHSELWAAFGGAILGALVAGLIQWVISARTARIEKRERQWAEAIRALLQATIIHSDVHSTINMIHEALESANEKGLTAERLWKRIPAFAGSFATRELDIDALSPFMEAKAYDLVADFITMVMRHQTLMESLKLYNTLRMEIDEMVPGPKMTPSGALYTELTDEDRARILPREIKMDALADSIRRTAPALEDLSRKIATAIGPTAKEYFSDTSFPGVEFTKKGSQMKMPNS